MHADVTAAIGLLNFKINNELISKKNENIVPFTSCGSTNSHTNRISTYSPPVTMHASATVKSLNSPNQCEDTRPSTPRKWFSSSTNTIDLIHDLPLEQHEASDHLSCISEDSDSNCHRFGHTRSHCNYDVSCKKCTGEHQSIYCTRKSMPPKCVNCQRHNANHRTKFAVYHCVKHELCPSRRLYMNNNYV